MAAYLPASKSLSPVRAQHAPAFLIIGGHSVCATHVAVLAKAGSAGSVLEDDSPFGGTIGENISCATDVPDMARVEQGARLACMHFEVMATPTGYGILTVDTANALSGGRQQRPFLARSPCQEPSIPILDEATSHPHVATEQHIAKAVAQLDITRVFAAPRPDTMAFADHLTSIPA